MLSKWSWNCNRLKAKTETQNPFVAQLSLPPAAVGCARAWSPSSWVPQTSQDPGWGAVVGTAGPSCPARAKSEYYWACTERQLEKLQVLILVGLGRCWGGILKGIIWLIKKYWKELRSTILDWAQWNKLELRKLNLCSLLSIQSHCCLLQVLTSRYQRGAGQSSVCSLSSIAPSSRHEFNFWLEVKCLLLWWLQFVSFLTCLLKSNWTTPRIQPCCLWGLFILFAGGGTCSSRAGWQL